MFEAVYGQLGRYLFRELLQLKTRFHPPIPHRVSLISTVWFWPTSHDAARTGLSDHPPRGKAFVSSLSLHLLLFMPALQSVAVFQLL